MAGKLEYSADFKRNYMAFFAIFIFVLMISAELVIALSIPRFVNRENAFADQIRKREMLLRFDETRRNCSAIRESNSVLGMEKRLLSDTVRSSTVVHSRTVPGAKHDIAARCIHRVQFKSFYVFDKS